MARPESDTFYSLRMDETHAETNGMRMWGAQFKGVSMTPACKENDISAHNL